MRLILLVCTLGLMFSADSFAGKPERFKAKLEGFDLAGAPVATAATGQARVEVIDDGGPPPSGTLAETVKGRLAEGFIYSPSQLDSPRPDITTVEELIDAIHQGRASVIIHTSDFPRGELRGTLQ